MKLRQKSKRDQALDAVASIAKTWSEWRLGDKVSKTTSQASKKASKQAAKAAKKAKKQAAKTSVPAVAKTKPVKIAGVVALVGGIGAVVAKKLSGGKAEPLYTPPGPAPDMAAPPPSPVAVEDLAKDSPPAGGTEVPSTQEPALTASTEVPPRDPSPVVVGDLTGDGQAEAEPPDTTAAPPDTTAEPPDTTAEPPDTTAEPPDTTAEPPDADLVSETAGEGDEPPGTSS
jgi:hypothetical protein